MQNGTMISGLNDALNRELNTIVRYLVESSTIHGRENEPIRAMYRKEIPDELGHAQYLADKIVMLGGTPSVKVEAPAVPNDVTKMMKNDLSAEEADVEGYKHLAQVAEQHGDVELKLRMETQAADEARHAQELRRLQA